MFVEQAGEIRQDPGRQVYGRRQAGNPETAGRESI